MPNPRYSNQREQERLDPKTKQLQQLAALKQIGGGDRQQELAQRGDNQRMLAAMQLLGLMNQQQESQGALGLREKQLAEETRYHDATLKQQQNAIEGSGMNSAIDNIMRDPNIPHEQKLALLAKSLPQLAPGIQAMNQQGLDTSTQKFAPMVQGMYSTYRDNPAELQKGLSALQQTMPPEVWNNQNWDQLNQSLPMPNAPTAGSGVGGLGSAIRNAPGAVVNGLQNAEDAMTGFGSQFWAGLLGVKPQAKDTRTFDQQVQQSKAWPW